MPEKAWGHFDERRPSAGGRSSFVVPVGHWPQAGEYGRASQGARINAMLAAGMPVCPSRTELLERLRESCCS